jgi:hypothetical protein
VARAERLCRLQVVLAEAERLHRRPEEIAYYLLMAVIHSLKGQDARDYLITAFALDHVPPGDGLGDRRRRFRLDESRVRDHEDEALEEAARWLLEMTEPEVLFGSYLSERPPLPVEWNRDTTIEPVAPDEIHPVQEIVWESLEKTSTLDERGLALETETRGVLRAMVDGVTGFTVHLTSDQSEYLAQGIGVRRGGKPGKQHGRGLMNSVRVNVNFHEPLRLHHVLQVHWFLDLVPRPKAGPLCGFAQNVDVPTRDLTLQIRFHPDKLPVQPCYFVSKPHLLPQAIEPKRPLSLMPGGAIAKTWRAPEIGCVYALAWEYAEAGDDQASDAK